MSRSATVCPSQASQILASDIAYWNSLVIPAIETPVFSVVPEDDGRFGALPWFSSEYRPLILSVRFLFLRYPKGFACPPAIKHNEFEGGKGKQYKPDSYHP